jgi:hypothetical protein
MVRPAVIVAGLIAACEPVPIKQEPRPAPAPVPEVRPAPVVAPALSPPPPPEPAKIAIPDGWGPWWIAADGSSAARTLGMLVDEVPARELVVVDRTSQVRRVALTGETVPAAELAGYRQLAADEVVPVFDVGGDKARVRARWQDRAGVVTHAITDREQRRCCGWTALQGIAAPGGEVVFAEVQLQCSRERPGCEVLHPAGAPWGRSLAAVVLDADAPAKQRYRPLSDAVVERMPDALTGDLRQANMLHVGPFGPAPDGILVLRTDDAGHLDGFLHTMIAGKVQRVPLARLPWTLNEVSEVVYADVDADGADEAIVLVTAIAGIGPEGAQEFVGAHVLKWDGEKIVTVEEAARRIGPMTTGAQVRYKLAKRAR